MNCLHIQLKSATRVLLVGAVVASVGCWDVIKKPGGEDAPTANARRTATIGDQMVIAASSDCPGAKDEIAAVQAASKASSEAAQAMKKISYDLDKAQIELEKSEAANEAALNERSAAEKAYNEAKQKYEEADAAYVKAKEAQEGYEFQMAATVSPSTLNKLKGLNVDQIKAKLNPISGSFDSALVGELGTDGVVVATNWAIARATRASLEEEHKKNAALRDEMKRKDDLWTKSMTKANAATKARDVAKAKTDALQAGYRAKRDAAIQATQAARIANYNLAQACPSAKGVLTQLDPSHSKGQDVFIGTQQQHQEP